MRQGSLQNFRTLEHKPGKLVGMKGNPTTSGDKAQMCCCRFSMPPMTVRNSFQIVEEGNDTFNDFFRIEDYWCVPI